MLALSRITWKSVVIVFTKVATPEQSSDHQDSAYLAQCSANVTYDLPHCWTTAGSQANKSAYISLQCYNRAQDEI